MKQRANECSNYISSLATPAACPQPEVEVVTGLSHLPTSTRQETWEGRQLVGEWGKHRLGVRPTGSNSCSAGYHLGDLSRSLRSLLGNGITVASRALRPVRVSRDSRKALSKGPGPQSLQNRDGDDGGGDGDDGDGGKGSDNGGSDGDGGEGGDGGDGDSDGGDGCWWPW
ncbi:hypothetical protein HJG60_010458 [Phyllostomus discolor]|uniref:Uncharacterized protein n=1 Tax=Phyllostomus discolor TaxID=89673 RepID=A0A834ALB3_9CHIR|nr:hypothetical protein HJG60_010458 [Phyllostomus discolor]